MRRLLRPLLLLVESVRRRGLRGTIGRALRLVKRRREARKRTQDDRAFDAARGIDTATWVRVPELDTDSPNRRFAVRYQPSSVEEFRMLLGKVPADLSDFAFVDYGSGKGRVLLLAAEHPFKRIMGVEFADSLDRVARENIATLGEDAERVETVVMDATEFDPPPEPLVLYFFNPFAPPVLKQVMARIRSSLKRNPRPAYIVLTAPPELAPVVEEAGFEPVDVERLGWLTRGVFAAKT